MKHFLACPPKLDDSAHAAIQLARPLEKLALFLEDAAATLHPSDADRAFASEFFENVALPVVALHPGSGGEGKNWPVENWRVLGERLMDSRFSISDRAGAIA